MIPLRHLPFLLTVLLALLPTITTTAALPTHSDINTTSLSTFYKRQCTLSPGTTTYTCDAQLPTLAEIVKRIQDTSDGGQADADTHAVFYSALVGANPSMVEVQLSQQWVLAWLESRRKSAGTKFYWWFEHINGEWRQAQATHILTSVMSNNDARWGDIPLRTFDYCSYQALAAAALNPIVYVFLPRGSHPKDQTWKGDSIWAAMEFWALTANPNVMKILRVDPRPLSVLGITPLQWCRWSEEEVLWERGVDAVLKPVWDCLVAYDANGNPQ